MTDTEIEAAEGLSPDELFEQIQAQEDAPEGKPEETPADNKVKIGDKEYDLETLATLVPVAERAQEIEKGARAKFDEAAEMRKQIDADKQEVEDMRTILDAWKNGTREQKLLIIKELNSEVDDGVNLEDPTPNEAALEKLLNGRIRQLEAVIQRQQAALDAVLPALDEIRKWTGSKQEAEKMQSDIAAIKEKTGIDVSPELLATWKDNGISDPVKAATGVMLPMLQKMQTEAGKPEKQDEIPGKTQANTFDPDDPNLGPDEIMNLMNKGYKPSH